MPDKPISAIDQRRLRSGVEAMACIQDVPANRAEAERLLDIIQHGSAALQSLDDLGEERNEKAWVDSLALVRRSNQLHQMIRDWESSGESQNEPQKDAAANAAAGCASREASSGVLPRLPEPSGDGA